MALSATDLSRLHGNEELPTMNLQLELKIAALRLLPLRVRRSIMERRWDEEIEVTAEGEMRFLQKLLKPGDLTVDVGANLGNYTYALHRITGNVLAIEPHPRLAKFIQALRYPGARVLSIALSSKDGVTDLHVPHFRSGHVLGSLKQDVAQSASLQLEHYRIATRRLDGLSLKPVSFIKIDVEGSEEEVLDGAGATIARDMPMLLIEIEERHNPGALQRICDRLNEYSAFFLYKEQWHPISDFEVGVHQVVTELDPIKYQTRRAMPYVNNFLFVPSQKAAQVEEALTLR